MVKIPPSPILLRSILPPILLGLRGRGIKDAEDACNCVEFQLQYNGKRKCLSEWGLRAVSRRQGEKGVLARRFSVGIVSLDGLYNYPSICIYPLRLCSPVYISIIIPSVITSQANGHRLTSPSTHYYPHSSLNYSHWQPLRIQTIAPGYNRGDALL